MCIGDLLDVDCPSLRIVCSVSPPELRCDDFLRRPWRDSHRYYQWVIGPPYHSYSCDDGNDDDDDELSIFVDAGDRTVSELCNGRSHLPIRYVMDGSTVSLLGLGDL